MAKPAISVTDVQVFTALRAFLLSIVPDTTEVIRTQANKVPTPVGLEWIAMTPTNRARIEKNRDDWDYSNANANTMLRTQNTRIEVQLDVYGPTGADTAAVIATLFNDPFACDYFDATNLPLAPLYATDGHQMPLLNGEAQYEQRWTMTLAIQANLAVSTAQDFASTLAVGLINVDVEYPPGA